MITLIATLEIAPLPEAKPMNNALTTRMIVSRTPAATAVSHSRNDACTSLGTPGRGLNLSTSTPVAASPQPPVFRSRSPCRSEARCVAGSSKYFHHESLLRSSLIESVSASTGCAIGPREEHEWVERMIQAELPRVHLLQARVKRFSPDASDCVGWHH